MEEKERSVCKDEGNKRTGRKANKRPGGGSGGGGGGVGATNLLDKPESEDVRPMSAIKKGESSPGNMQLIPAAAHPADQTNSGFHGNKQNI